MNSNDREAGNGEGRKINSRQKDITVAEAVPSKHRRMIMAEIMLYKSLSVLS